MRRAPEVPILTVVSRSCGISLAMLHIHLSGSKKTLGFLPRSLRKKSGATLRMEGAHLGPLAIPEDWNLIHICNFLHPNIGRLQSVMGRAWSSQVKLARVLSISSQWAPIWSPIDVVSARPLPEFELRAWTRPSCSGQPRLGPRWFIHSKGTPRHEHVGIVIIIVIQWGISLRCLG
ncbi:hypothetical protein BS47DRAFT_568780 [Hydnum rufescens UP504]|uniref:Uncharacterized protein n=1 Tax=Hydnum rufescens UP504 TaxID=1448309 RepID=A0A9P6DZU5_9AGAM|nr:hypothetical protein BS47DRAFT_568780 [Hydnum rufescens UP504]